MTTEDLEECIAVALCCLSSIISSLKPSATEAPLSRDLQGSAEATGAVDAVDEVVDEWRAWNSVGAASVSSRPRSAHKFGSGSIEVSRRTKEVALCKNVLREKYTLPLLFLSFLSGRAIHDPIVRLGITVYTPLGPVINVTPMHVYTQTNKQTQTV